jgi:hypothetical protein
MADLVLDTDALADFLAQFYGATSRGQGRFTASDWLSEAAAREINRIRDQATSGRLRDLLIASCLAFVEVVRKWGALARGRFQPWQLKAFLQAPPEWFSVAPVDEDLVESFLEVPGQVVLPGVQQVAVEWTDAVHVATVFSRANQALFRSQDRRLRQVEQLAGRIV